MSIDDLIAGIVSIRCNGTIAGTGFIISDSGLIATCAHVVESTAFPEDKITIHFQTENYEYQAQVIGKWRRNSDNEDVAILQVEGGLPKGVQALKLGSSAGTSNHKVRTFGFPKVGEVNGIWGQGEVVGKVRERDYFRIQLRSREITAGFSGAPVWDESRHRIIGMVVTIAQSDVYTRLQETAFAIPSETLQAICSELKIEDICPYRGLLPFQEEDTNFFFGRKALVDELANQLRRNPHFLAVVGSSGSGKSSIIRAGLLPRIRRSELPGFENAKIIIFRPGATPNQALGKSIQGSGVFNESDNLWDSIRLYLEREPDSRVLLFSDQFEEIFAHSTESEKTDFLRNLADLMKSRLPITVIIAIRADFYEPLMGTFLGEYLRTSQFNIRQMSEEEMREAITSPVKIVGWEIEPGLVDLIITDLKSTKNPLPLLEFALTQLWLKREDGTLTIERYRQIGGATGAIGQWASEMYNNQLSVTEQQLCRRIFTRLVHCGEGDAPDTRQSAPFSELTGGEGKQDILQLIKKLADFRLLVTDRDLKTGVEIAEIVHESLLHEWLQFRDWIQDQRSFLLWRQRLDERFDEWRERGQDDGSLLRGASLVEAEGWLKERSDELSAVEQDYIQISLKLQKKETSDRERRRRSILMGLAIFSIITLALAGFSGVQWQMAEKQKQIANEQSNTAIARQLAFQSEIVRGRSLNLAVLLAVESLNKKETMAGNQALMHGLELLPISIAQREFNDTIEFITFSPDGKYIAIANGSTARVWDVASSKNLLRIEHSGLPVEALTFSPDGKHLATASWKWLFIVDIETNKQIAQIDHDLDVYHDIDSIIFSPDGKYIATTSSDNTTRIWDPATGKQLARMEHDNEVSAVIFSPDGKYIATANWTIVRIWDAATGKQLAWIKQDYFVNAVTFSPDGKHLAIASWRTLWIWDLDTGKQPIKMEHDHDVNSVTFSPDGEHVATASYKTARIWDAATGKELARMEHDDEVKAITFNPDGKHLATISSTTARIWDAATGKELARMEHDIGVNAVTFSSDGKYVATAGWDRTSRIWDANTGKQLARMEHNSFVNAVTFSPDGKYVATASTDSTARIWDFDTGKQLARMEHSFGVDSVIFSPDGKYIATAGSTTAMIWDVATGKELARMEHDTIINSVTFSPDGKYVATASWDKTARIWDAATGKQLMRMEHDGEVNSVTFSPDGKYVATASSDNTTRIWDAATGKQLMRMEHDSEVKAVTFSPDGKYVATAGYTTARIWDAATGKQLAHMENDTIIRFVTFSPDGKYIATAGYTTAMIWDAATGKQLARMEHDDFIRAVTFSPDGKYVATASLDKTARIWDAATGKQLAQMEHHGDVKAVTFSPDGKYVATASWDKSARIWLWRPMDMINEACSRLTRNLKPEEWLIYMGDQPYRKTCPELP